MDRKVFVTWDGDHIGAQIGRLTLQDDASQIRRLSMAIDAGNMLWKAWTENNGGSVINVGGDEGRVEIPLRCIEEIPDMAKKYLQAVGATCCVGVGSRLSEAQKALAVAKLVGPNTIKCYTSELEDQLEQMTEDKDPEAQKILKEYFQKSEGPAIDYRISFKQLADNSDKIRSVQEEAAQNESESKQWRDELKFKVSEALKDFRANMPQLSALKESAPEAYRSLLAVVSSVADMSAKLFQREQLIGGKGDFKTDAEFDPNQMKEGLSHEMEHTDNPDVAKEIARDHLSESPDYYTKLKTIETHDSTGLDELGVAHPHDNEMWVEDHNQPLQKFEELAKGKKDALQMYKPEHPGAQGAKKHVEWAYSKLPNENWSMWAVGHHRENPKDFTPAVKRKIEHFAGSQHIPEIAKVRFDKKHDLHTGLKMLQDAEDRYLDRKKNQLNLAPKPKKAKKIVDFGDGYAWWSLGKGSCSKEGEAMGHCGNVPSEEEGDNVLSLRKEHVLGGQKYYEPHLTFIQNGSYLGEMKGRGNKKPAPHYHDKIAELLKTGLTPVGGGYEPEGNFNMDDMSPEYHEKLKATNAHPHYADPQKALNDFENKKLPPKRRKLAASAFVLNRAVTPDMLDELLKNPTLDRRLMAYTHPNATEDQVSMGLKDPRVDTRVLNGARLTPKHIEPFIAEYSNDSSANRVLYDGQREIGSNKNLPLETQHAFFDSLYSQEKDKSGGEGSLANIHAYGHMASNEGIHPEIQKKIFDLNVPSLQDKLAKNPKVSSDIVGKILNADNGYFATKAAIESGRLTKQHVDDYFSSNTPQKKIKELSLLAKHYRLKPEQLDTIMPFVENNYDAKRILDNKGATAEHVKKLLGHGDDTVRAEAIQHPAATSEQISNAIDNDDPYVAEAALSNPKIEAEHIRKGILHSSSNVVEAAVRHPASTPEHWSGALDRTSDLTASHRGGVRRAVLDRLFNSPDAPKDLPPQLQHKLIDTVFAGEDHGISTTLPYGIVFAEKRNLIPEVQVKLAKHPLARFRASLAGNPNLHESAQSILAKDPDPEVRRLLAGNPNLHPSVHPVLANDRDETVRQYIAAHKERELNKAESGSSDIESKMLKDYNYYGSRQAYLGGTEFEAAHSLEDIQRNPKKHGWHEGLSAMMDVLGNHAKSKGWIATRKYPVYSNSHYLHLQAPHDGESDEEPREFKIRFADHEKQSGLHDPAHFNLHPTGEHTFQHVFDFINQGPHAMFKAEEDYRGSHQAPGRDGGSPMHDLSGTYPEDIYSGDAARLYGHSEPYDNESVSPIHASKGKADAQIKIYRAVPAELTIQDRVKTLEKHKAHMLKTGRLPPDAPPGHTKDSYYEHASNELDRLQALPPEPAASKMNINPGDWVTTSKSYAHEHGKGALGGKYKILSKIVPAKHLFTDGNSIHEWGYDPHDMNKDEIATQHHAIGTGKTGRHHTLLPVGSTIDTGPSGTRNVGKIKIRRQDGKTSWISVRAGLVMGPDGNPRSSRSSVK